EDGWGKEEVAGITVNLPELFDIPKELDVGVFDTPCLFARWGNFRHTEESRQGGKTKPHGGKNCHQADIEPALGANAQQAAIAGNKPEVANQQQENPAKITKRPAQARNLAHVVFSGYLGNLREVVDLRKFDGDGANRKHH